MCGFDGVQTQLRAVVDIERPDGRSKLTMLAIKMHLSVDQPPGRYSVTPFRVVRMFRVM